ncbi:hypothetical protein DJICPGNB_10910 [Proteus mirabilis]|nr:hypothetical protein DJICPGNB_10910 [Proteus mirabilis]
MKQKYINYANMFPYLIYGLMVNAVSHQSQLLPML